MCFIASSTSDDERRRGKWMRTHRLWASIFWMITTRTKVLIGLCDWCIYVFFFLPLSFIHFNWNKCILMVFSCEYMRIIGWLFTVNFIWLLFMMESGNGNRSSIVMNNRHFRWIYNQSWIWIQVSEGVQMKIMEKLRKMESNSQ